MAQKRTIVIFGEMMVIEYGEYPNTKNIYLALYDESGEQYGHPSYNPSFEMLERLVAVKDYSEYEGWVEELQMAGVIGERVATIPSGYVEIGVYEFLL